MKSPYAAGRRWCCEPAGKPAFDFVIIAKGSRPDRKMCRIECDNPDTMAHGISQEYTHKHLKKYAQLIEGSK